MSTGRRYGGAPAPRKGYGRPNFTRPAGVLAYHDGTCGRCDQPIQRHVSQVVERKGTWIHVGCAPGADE
jgi:hypothetical protein